MSAGWRVKIYSLAARSTVMTMVLELGAAGFGWGRSILQRGALESASLPVFQLDGSSTPFPNSWTLWLPQWGGEFEKTPQNTPQLALQG